MNRTDTEAMIRSRGGHYLGVFWSTATEQRPERLRYLRSIRESTPQIALPAASHDSADVWVVLTQPTLLAGSEIYAHRLAAKLGTLRVLDVPAFMSRPLEELLSVRLIVSTHSAMIAVIRRCWALGNRGPRIIGLINTSPSEMDVSRMADLIVVNTAVELYPEASVGPTICVHPPVWEEPPPRDLCPSGIVQFNLAAGIKGPEVFAHLAAAMPAEKFTAVRGAYGTQLIPSLPNVTVRAPSTSLVRELFGRVAVVIVPSERETYGMIAAEALAAGVPVVVSDLPGLREACGSGAYGYVPLDHPRRFGAWEGAVRAVLRDEEHAQARARAWGQVLRRRQTNELRALRKVVDAL